MIDEGTESDIAIAKEKRGAPVWVAYLQHKPFALEIASAIDKYRFDTDDSEFAWIDTFR